MLACGLDVAEFVFFAADVAGQSTDVVSTRRGILALRNFEPGETLMSVPFDGIFSIEQLHRSQIRHLVPIFRERGMNDIQIMTITLM